MHGVLTVTEPPHGWQTVRQYACTLPCLIVQSALACLLRSSFPMVFGPAAATGQLLLVEAAKQPVMALGLQASAVAILAGRILPWQGLVHHLDQVR